MARRCTPGGWSIRRPRAQVIYWHGNGGNLSLWLDVIADLHRHGLSVLAVDYRGYGGEQRKTKRAWRLPRRGAVPRSISTSDCGVQDRAGHLLGTIPRLRGGIVRGRSRTPPDALVLESPFPDVDSLFRRNPVMRTSERFFELLVCHDPASREICRAVAGHPRRRRLDHSVRAGRQRLRRRADPRKTFTVLKGADHNDVHAGPSRRYWPRDRPLIANLETLTIAVLSHWHGITLLTP